MPHLAREPLASRFPCHVTVRVRDDVPSLRAVRLVRALERSFGAARERGEFRLVHYSIQTNHVHLIVEAKDRRALARGTKSLGARIARAANRVFGRRGPVLADRYHLRVLRSPRQVRNALEYVLLNAARHARRRLRRPDPASSGRWFDGWRVGRAENDAPVAGAHTWLLRVGWRRYGRIALDALPGRAPP